MAVSAGDVKALRDRTGAGMMDSKAALTEAEGDVERAIEILRVKGQASAAKREGRGTDEGVVSSYIHANHRVEAMAKEEGKPDNVVEKIVEGQMTKWAREITLLEQEHVNADKHERKTIEELRQELAAKTGENVRVARFAYFRVGED